MNACKQCGKNLPNSNLRIFCNCGYINDPIPTGIISSNKQSMKSNLENFLNELRNSSREHWYKLHKYAVLNRDWNPDIAQKWYLDWEQNIPNIGCSCTSHWRNIVSKHPPQFQTPEDFFAWSVKVHNIVNERLKKPIVSLEEAKRIHSF